MAVLFAIFSAAHRAQQYQTVDGCVLIRLSHTAKIGATFQTESGMAGPLDGPEGDRAAEFPEKLLASWGSGSVGVTAR